MVWQGLWNRSRQDNNSQDQVLIQKTLGRLSGAFPPLAPGSKQDRQKAEENLVREGHQVRHEKVHHEHHQRYPEQIGKSQASCKRHHSAQHRAFDYSAQVTSIRQGGADPRRMLLQ
jgi:hypothetical protein